MYKYMNLWKLHCPEGEGEGGGGEPAPKGGLTQEDVDRAVQARLARERKAFDAEKEAAIKKALEDAKLSAEELAKKQQEEIAAKLAEREAELTRRELKAKAQEELGKKKLPADLLELVSLSSEEDMNKSLGQLEAAFTKSLQAAVDEKLKGSTPPAGNGTADELTRFREAIGLSIEKDKK